LSEADIRRSFQTWIDSKASVKKDNSIRTKIEIQNGNIPDFQSPWVRLFVPMRERMKIAIACLPSLADIAMDRDNEIGDDREMKRTFKTEPLEYLDEPLLTNRNIKQSRLRDNHFDVLSYWRDKTRDWPNLAFFCRCLYATMATSVIC
jgi:hypothetical protein